MFERNDIHVVITRGQEYNAAAKALDSFVESMNLSVRKNNQLVGLIMDLVTAAERNATVQAFRFGQEMNAVGMFLPECPLSKPE